MLRQPNVRALKIDEVAEAVGSNRLRRLLEFPLQRVVNTWQNSSLVRQSTSLMNTVATVPT